MRFEFLTAALDDCPLSVQPAFFGFECPRGKDGFMCSGLVIRGNGGGLPQADYDKAVREKRTWQWNGDRDRPTFSPSINCGSCSHGYIEKGVWRDA